MLTKNEDITYLQENNQVIGYVVLRRLTDSSFDIVKYDLEGNMIPFEVPLSFSEKGFLHPSKDGFILYGSTKEVELKKGNASYYILRYDQKGNILSETIGEEAVNENERIILLTIGEEYYILYRNEIDSSYEVVKIDKDGIEQKKIKKINNNYYMFNDYSMIENTLYFVGQINCPEKDNCDYRQNNLFLISDEDKVIEVKDKDSKSILIGISILIILLVGLVLIKKKRKL